MSYLFWTSLALAILLFIIIILPHVVLRLRRLVSKKKRRFKQGRKYDFDLTYVTESIVAMAFPAKGIATLWRNRRSSVVEFFNSRHEGDNVKIYSFCKEPSYIYSPRTVAPCHFEHFPFRDHRVPPLSYMKDFSDSAHAWLQSGKGKQPKSILADGNDPDVVAGRKVVALHCRAGKGRTGVMSSCLLIRENIAQSPSEAVSLFSQRRLTRITSPSQRRYISYYYHMHSRLGNSVPEEPSYILRRVTIQRPQFTSQAGRRVLDMLSWRHQHRSARVVPLGRDEDCKTQSKSITDQSFPLKIDVTTSDSVVSARAIGVHAPTGAGVTPQPQRGFNGGASKDSASGYPHSLEFDFGGVPVQGNLWVECREGLRETSPLSFGWGQCVHFACGLNTAFLESEFPETDVSLEVHRPKGDQPKARVHVAVRLKKEHLDLACRRNDLVGEGTTVVIEIERHLDLDGDGDNEVDGDGDNEVDGDGDNE
eukprot:Rmarinus@m.16281